MVDHREDHISAVDPVDDQTVECFAFAGRQLLEDHARQQLDLGVDACQELLELVVGAGLLRQACPAQHSSR